MSRSRTTAYRSFRSKVVTQETSIHWRNRAGELPNRTYAILEVDRLAYLTAELRKILLVLLALLLGKNRKENEKYFYKKIHFEQFFHTKMHFEYHAEITSVVMGCRGIEHTSKYEREVARFKPSLGTEVFLEYFKTRCNETSQESLDRTRLIGIINEKRLSKLPDPIEQLVFIPYRLTDLYSNKNYCRNGRSSTLTSALQARKKQPSQDICQGGEQRVEPHNCHIHLKRMSSQENNSFNLLSPDRIPIENLEILNTVADPLRRDLQSPSPNKPSVRVSKRLSPTKSNILQSKNRDISFSNSPAIPANESKKKTSFKITKTSVQRNRENSAISFATPKRVEGTSLATQSDIKPAQVVSYSKPKVQLSAQDPHQRHRSGQQLDVTAILAGYQQNQAFLVAPIRRFASPGQMPRESLTLSLPFNNQTRGGLAGACMDLQTQPAEKTTDSFSKRLELKNSMNSISHLDTKIATENFETLVTPTNKSSNSSALFGSQTQEFLQVPSAWAALEHKRQLLKKHSTDFSEKSTDRYGKTSFSLCIDKLDCMQ